MTQKLASRFSDYAEFHTTKGNQVTHYFGIPMIAISTLGLLALVTFGNEAFRSQIIRPDLGWALWALAVGFYLYLDWKIALPFTLMMTGMYLIGRSLPWEILVGLNIVGWVIQYYGHIKYEKNSPAFYQNVSHMLIAPLWIFSKLIRYGAKT